MLVVIACLLLFLKVVLNTFGESSLVFFSSHELLPLSNLDEDSHGRSCESKYASSSFPYLVFHIFNL